MNRPNCSAGGLNSPALKHELARGIDDLENGRHQTYHETNALQLAEEWGDMEINDLNMQTTFPETLKNIALLKFKNTTLVHKKKKNG